MRQVVASTATDARAENEQVQQEYQPDFISASINIRWRNISRIISLIAYQP